MTLLDYVHGSQAPIAAPVAADTTPGVEVAETKAEAAKVDIEEPKADAPIAPAIVAAAPAADVAEPVIEVSRIRMLF